MDSMSEQWWEKKLNIRTAGKVDHFIEEAFGSPCGKRLYFIRQSCSRLWVRERAHSDLSQFQDRLPCDRNRI